MTQRKSARVRDRAWEAMNDNDRISRLPEGIIHHIFSFLDTRCVVQSSVLSSRWRDTWKSHPQLKFKIDRSTDPTSSSRFSNFVHQFLSKRDNSIEASIIDVHLKTIRLPLLKEIIMYATSHRSQKLNIEFLGEGPTRRGGFDLSIFRSPFLQQLCLEIDFVVLKTSILTWDMPVLTTLNLAGVKFALHPTNDGASNSLELFSTLPNLQTLVLVGCKLLNIDRFIIMSNGLENLTMRDLNHTCQFEILAPKLKSFTFYGMADFSLLAKGLCSLETVEFHAIYHRSIENRSDLVELMINTFSQLSKAQFLTINSEVLRFLSEFPSILEKQPCPFMGLQSLTLVEWQIPTWSFLYANIISYFSSNSPALTVNMGIDPAPSINRN